MNIQFTLRPPLVWRLPLNTMDMWGTRNWLHARGLRLGVKLGEVWFGREQGGKVVLLFGIDIVAVGNNPKFHDGRYM